MYGHIEKVGVSSPVVGKTYGQCAYMESADYRWLCVYGRSDRQVSRSELYSVKGILV